MVSKRQKLDLEKVDETNYDAWNFNDFPNEIILNIFNYLTQNQLARVARYVYIHSTKMASIFLQHNLELYRHLYRCWNLICLIVLLVCRRWNVLKKSPALWRKVNVQIFRSSDGEGEDESFKSLIDGLPSCVTFIKLDFFKRGYLDSSERMCYLNFEELCTKLHQKCPQVEVLILTGCSISTGLSEVINSCTQFLQDLKKLVLHLCHFKDYSGTAELEDNSKIEVLDLYLSVLPPSNKIKFSKLLSLKELRLTLTSVNDAWFVGDTSFLNHVQVFDLGLTNVCWAASTFTAIQTHGQNLKELYLCYLSLGDRDFSFNGPVFPHLQTICLSGTSVTCEALVSLVRSCPSLVSVYVDEVVTRSFSEHPFVVANRCKLGIVKSFDRSHNHNVDYLHS